MSDGIDHGNMAVTVSNDGVHLSITEGEEKSQTNNKKNYSDLALWYPSFASH